MALTEQKIVDKIELVGNPAYRSIQVRYDNQIFKDGVLLHTGNYERVALNPGSLVDNVYVQMDVSGYELEIRNIAEMCWTESAHTAYEAFLRSR